MLSNDQPGRRLSSPFGQATSALRLLIVLSTVGLPGAQTAPTPNGSTGQTSSQPSTNHPAPSPPAPPLVVPPAATSPIANPPKPLVMIDAAHGGSESGAVLNSVILEKDVTLALARRLRLDLSAHGIVAGLVRDSDVTPSTDDRAAQANAEHPVLYICLHATSEARGIRIYSATLSQVEENRGPFVDWSTAQSLSVANSRTAQQQLMTAIQKIGIPVRSLELPLLPLNNVTTSAVAIELAPTTGDVSQLISPDYQQTVSGALANGISGVLSSLGQNSGASR
jgi:N-acetylmuramoyl-L-alanine amidase